MNSVIFFFVANHIDTEILKQVQDDGEEGDVLPACAKATAGRRLTIHLIDNCPLSIVN